MFFNSVIRSIDIVYLQTCFTVAVQIGLVIKDSEFQDQMDQKAAIVLGSILIGVPIIYSIFLTVYSKEITSRSFKKKFESMYEDIHNYRSKWSKYYIVLSMIRRMLYAIIPALVYRYSYFRVQLLILLSTGYVITYANIRPHIFSRRFRLELFNESMIMIFNYHILLWTDFCYDNEFQYSVGDSFRVCLLILVFVNIIMMLTNAVVKYKRKKYLATMKKVWKTKVALFNEE